MALKAYLVESNAFETIIEAGHQIYIHVPITGGPDVVHTSQSLDELITSFPAMPFIIWKNLYHGELVIDGKTFEEFKIYKKNVDKFAAIVDIPHKKQSTFGKDIEIVLAKKCTFNTAINSSMPVMARQRLKTYWSEACAAMENSLVFSR